MKSNLTKVSIALLSVVFILGCQDLGPVGPDGLVPQFDKKGTEGDLCPDGIQNVGPFRDAKGHCHGDDEPDPVEDATFTADFTGEDGVVLDVDGVATPLSGPQSGKKKLSGGGVHQPDILLTFTTFLQTANGYTGGEGANCFPAGVYGGSMGIFQNTPGSDEAIIHYNFDGQDKVNGGTEIRYALLLRGTLDPADWVPAKIGDVAVIDGAKGTFEIAPGHGPGDISCKGTGDVDFTIEVTLNPA